MIRPESDDSISAGLWVVLARAYRSMAMYVEQSVAKLGIGLSDFMILEALLHKGPMTMSALCDAVLIKGASMTAAVDRLEKKQFVERASDERDRRARLVRLTAEGTSTAKSLYRRHLRDLDELMGYLPITDRMDARETLKTLGRVAHDRVVNGPLDMQRLSKKRLKQVPEDI
jgi:MarR family transcriptional regulator, 2-MHQ and catechol-resistance regulon repressor